MRARSLCIAMGGLVHGVDWIPTKFDYRASIARRLAEDMTQRLREMALSRRDLGGARWWTKGALERLDGGGEPRNIAMVALGRAPPVPCLDVKPPIDLPREGNVRVRS